MMGWTPEEKQEKLSGATWLSWTLLAWPLLLFLGERERRVENARGEKESREERRLQDEGRQCPAFVPAWPLGLMDV